MESCIPQVFEQRVSQFPMHLALQNERTTLTYADLNRAANRLAHTLLADYGDAHETVALLFDQGVDILIAFLAVLKAGKIVVPLDPAYPRTRTTYMLEDSQARLIITDTAHEPLAQDLTQRQQTVLNLEKITPHTPDHNPNLAIDPYAFAYILYTSGSTGDPKGVIENHRNVIHFVEVFRHSFPLTPDDRLTLLTSCSFSASMADLFSALLTGASLHLFNVKRQGIAQLADWLRQHRITIYHSVPTVYRHFVKTLPGDAAMPSLKLIYLAGESIYPLDVELYKAHFSTHCRFLSALGSTEMKIFQQYFIDHQTNLPGPFVPVGYSVDDTEIVLLDADGYPMSGKGPGEIAVRSAYNPPGYWRKPAQTNATFGPAPDGSNEPIYRTGDLGRRLPDGCLVHLGRKDSQVKVRGYRIELNEVVSSLLNTGLFSEAVVTLHQPPNDMSTLVAYGVPATQPPPTPSAIRQLLSSQLPEYMIPSRVICLDSMPLTPTGKVDQSALPEPLSSRASLAMAYVPPRTTTETQLTELWADLLGIIPVGIHDSFQDLGGHSLLATQLLARITTTFGVDLPLVELISAPTVSDQAVLITQHQAENLNAADLTALLNEVETLTEDELRELLADEAAEG